jgi:glycosyltransferase involved in cell wall biosynthesis
MPDLPALKDRVERMLWDYFRWLDANTQTLISPTETIAGTIEKFSGRRPAVIPNGINIDRFRPEPLDPGERSRTYTRFDLDPDRPVVLHVGRLDVDKQVDLVIRAAAKVLRQSDAQLVIAGDGRQRDNLEDLARRSGIAQDTRFPGFVSSTGDLPALYRIGNAFVTASEIEVQPLVLLEALASGLPVVAVRATSIPEVVKEGVNGYLVEPKNTDALAERILALIRDPQKAKQMGLHGRSVASAYSMAVSVEKHEAFYANLAAGGRVPSAEIRSENLRKFYDRFIGSW